MHVTLKVLLNPLTLILVCCMQVTLGQTQVETDPIALQQQGIQRYERVLEYRRKTGDNESTVPQLRLAAFELLSSASALLNKGNIASCILSVNKAGNVQRLLNMPVEAQKSFQMALEISVRVNFTEQRIRALLGLAKNELYRSGQRDYQTVAKYLNEALPLATASGDKEGLCDIWLTKADLEVELRDFIAAARSVNNALPLADGLPDRMYLFFAYQSSGLIYSQLAGNCDYDRGVQSCYDVLNHAKADYEKAQAVAKALGYDFLTTFMARSLNSLELRRQQVALKETESRLNDKISQVTSLFRPQKAGDVLVSQTFLPPKSSDSSTSGAALLTLKPLLEKLIERAQDSATGNFLRGSLKDLTDQPDAALDYYLTAVKILDSDSLNLRDDTSVGTFLEDKIQIYYNPMLHLLERRRYAEAFDLMENSRTRAMADLLRAQDVKVQLEDGFLYSDYKRVLGNLSLARRLVFRERGKADTAQNQQSIADKEKEIQGLEKEYQTTLKRISATSPNLLALLAPQTASLQLLQQSLKQDRSEVLYYLVLDKQIIIWHISAAETHVLSVFLPRAELIKKVDRLRKSLNDPHNLEAKFNPDTSKELFLFLIQPVLKWIKTDHLVIVPHEDLNYVPFQTFYDGEKNQYLGERFQISYAPSATILSRLKRPANIREGNLLAVEASGLPEAQKEVEALGQLYPGRSRVVVNSKLREADVKNWVGDYDVIHLSVHGTFESKEPLLSYLMFQPGEASEGLMSRIMNKPSGGTRTGAPNLSLDPDDGRLSTSEMFALELSGAQLVVLSACETGQAKATRANEVIGMERALLYAGANSLVLSSWKVDPAATELWMTTFYREARSKPLSEAARLALMAVRSDSKYSHPYYWSPFLLIGR